MDDAAVAHAILAMYADRFVAIVEEGLARAEEYRRVTAADLQRHQRVVRRLREADISGHNRYAKQIDLGTHRGDHDCRGIIRSGIGVNNESSHMGTCLSQNKRF